MKKRMERDLLRLLTGELAEEEARTVEERLAEDPELQETYKGLKRTWEGLVLPPPSPSPGFTAAVMAKIREEAGSDLTWSLAPAWARAVAGLALAAGVALGIALGIRDGALPGEAFVASEPSLAESYWLELEATPEGALDEEVEP